MKSSRIICFCVYILILFQPVSAQYNEWKYSGSFFINTTEEGAFLPESATVEQFPVLVRLSKDFFNFSQAEQYGEDLRFSMKKGEPLAYQIEKWDRDRGIADIWVRVPEIRGNSRQEIVVWWGKQDVESESSGSAVFNRSNGFLSVWHMNSPVRDEVGTLHSIDRGSVKSEGVIGDARQFRDGQHIYCGDSISAYPSGGEERTTEAWVFALKPGWAVDWGMEKRCQENSLKFSKPPALKHEGYLCDANGSSRLRMKRWYHVAATYKKGQLAVYVNGKEDGSAERLFKTPDTYVPHRHLMAKYLMPNKVEHEVGIVDCRLLPGK